MGSEAPALMPPQTRKPRTIESRRASGEATPLPYVVGGRPTQDEMGAPASLDRWGRAAWREVVPLLLASKLIDRVDRQALEAYALHMGRARALREEIEWAHIEAEYDDEGALLNSRGSGQAHPQAQPERAVQGRDQHEGSPATPC